MSGAKAVREDRLWQRHVDMAKLGGTPKGGVNRQALSPEDAAAETLKAAPAPMREGKPGFPLDFYVEAHIEQGPRLENERKTIGVVTAIQGSRRYIVEIDGEEAHAGTTPRAARKDAFAAATRIAAAM